MGAGEEAPRTDINPALLYYQAFLLAPEEILNPVRERGWRFYTFIGGAARFMFSWDTDPARVDALCRDLKECAAQAHFQQLGMDT